MISAGFWNICVTQRRKEIIFHTRRKNERTRLNGTNVLTTDSQRVSFVYHKERKLPFKFNQRRICNMNGNERNERLKENSQIYQWRDVGEGTKEEPNETLTNRDHTNQSSRTESKQDFP